MLPLSNSFHKIALLVCVDFIVFLSGFGTKYGARFSEEAAEFILLISIVHIKTFTVIICIQFASYTVGLIRSA